MASHAGDVWALLAALVWTILGDYHKVCLRTKSSAQPPPPPPRPCRSASGTSLFSSLTPFSFRLFSLRIIVTTSTAQDHHTTTAGSQSGRSGRSGEGSGSGGRGIFGGAFLLLYSIAWRSLDNSWVMWKVGEIILKSILVGTRRREGPGAAQTDKGGQHVDDDILNTRRGCG